MDIKDQIYVISAVFGGFNFFLLVLVIFLSVKVASLENKIKRGRQEDVVDYRQQMANPQMANPQMANSQLANSQMANPQMANLQRQNDELSRRGFSAYTGKQAQPQQSQMFGGGGGGGYGSGYDNSGFNNNPRQQQQRSNFQNAMDQIPDELKEQMKEQAMDFAKDQAGNMMSGQFENMGMPSEMSDQLGGFGGEALGAGAKFGAKKGFGKFGKK